MVRITIAFAIVTISGMLIFSGSARVSTSPTFREIPNPASHGSLAPGLSVTEEGIPILSWIEPSGTSKALKFAAWNGQSWAKPGTVLVNGEIEADSASPPTVVKLPSGALVAVWSQITKGKGKEEGNFLFAAASTTDGKSWSVPARIHSDTSVSEHSFDSIAVTGHDQATIVWLDSRDNKAKHRYRLMSVIVDSNGALRDEVTIDEDTCTCCPTAFVSTPTAALAAYRGHSPQEIRDIKIVRRIDGKWQVPSTVHDDLWKINGCPVNGPALGINGNNLGVLWFTGTNDKAEIRFAVSHDLGSTFRSPITLDIQQEESRPVGHVAVALLDDGSAVGIWLQHKGDSTRILGRKIAANGQLGKEFVIATGTERGLGYPRMQRTGKTVIVSWSGKTGLDVRTAIIEASND